MTESQRDAQRVLIAAAREYQNLTGNGVRPAVITYLIRRLEPKKAAQLVSSPAQKKKLRAAALALFKTLPTRSGDEGEYFHALRTGGDFGYGTFEGPTQFITVASLKDVKLPWPFGDDDG